MRPTPYSTPTGSVKRLDELCHFPLDVPTPPHETAILRLLANFPRLQPEFDHDHRLIAITGTRRAYVELLLSAAATRSSHDGA